MSRRLLALAALGVASQRANAETLADAIALAYRTNPSVEGSRYAVREADEGVVQAQAELRPTADLQVSGEYDRTIEGRTSAASHLFGPPAKNQSRDQIAVSLVQPLFTGGKATAERASAEATVRTARETLRGAEGDLMLSIITAYVDIRRYGSALEVWRASVVELEKIEKEIEARQEAGELTRTDVAQAQSQLTEAQEQVVETEQALEAARADYASLVGRPAGDLAPVPDLPLVPATADTAFDLAQRQSPELAQAIYAERASRDDIAVAKAAGRPTLSLRGSATLSGEAYPYHLYNQDQGFTGSLVVTMPLMAGGRIASQTRQAEDRNSQDRLRIETARREMVRTITYSWNQMVTSQRAAGLILRREGAAATQLDGTLAEYRVGLRSTFDVLYAQQTLRDAQVSMLGAERDRYVAEATLLRRIGLLEPRSVMTGVSLHDPALHLRAIERKNALPWDEIVAGLDRSGAPGPKQRRLEQPAASRNPALVRAPADLPQELELVRGGPETPIPGTVGRPFPATGRSSHDRD